MVKGGSCEIVVWIDVQFWTIPIARLKTMLFL